MLNMVTHPQRIRSHDDAPLAQPDGHCAPGGLGMLSRTVPPLFGTQKPPDCTYDPAPVAWLRIGQRFGAHMSDQHEHDHDDGGEQHEGKRAHCFHLLP
jgi:hypothetical protein